MPDGCRSESPSSKSATMALWCLRSPFMHAAESHRDHALEQSRRIIGTPERFKGDEQIGSYVGRIPSEDSRAGHQRLGHGVGGGVASSSLEPRSGESLG